MKIFKEEESSSFFGQNASVVSVKVTSHGYYARFTRKRGAGSIDHFRFIIKIVSFESKLLVDRLTCPFVPGTAISNVSSASLSLSLPSCFVLERGLNDGVGARMIDLDEKALGNWSFSPFSTFRPLSSVSECAYVDFEDRSLSFESRGDANSRLGGNYVGGNYGGGFWWRDEWLMLARFVTFSWNTEEKGLFSGRKREIIIIGTPSNRLT